MKCIGDKKKFAIEYSYFDESHETEIAMYINGTNILEYKRNGMVLTTRWDLDDIVEWLRHFIDNMKDDPYPVEAEGKYAAQKDISARDFDSDDDAEFDAYYDKLYNWNLRHRWHTEANGAILADVYFEQKGSQVEISWNNEDEEGYADYTCMLGGASIDKSMFCRVVTAFIIDYAEHWFE
ncbi:MAG: hypothetical protein ACOYJH_00345 [Anaerovoracaceae bacterium]|jgi:hypothetical protein